MTNMGPLIRISASPSGFSCNGPNSGDNFCVELILCILYYTRCPWRPSGTVVLFDVTFFVDRIKKFDLFLIVLYA